MKLLWLTAAICFVFDQATKFAVVHWLNLKTLGYIEVWPPVLQFKMAWNYGINFGLFANSDTAQSNILISIAFGVLAIVLYWLWKNPPPKIGYIAAGFLVGGALGNVVDRFLYGAVADFLNMSCCGISNPFAFNFADVTIFIGAVGLAIFTNSSKE